MVLVILSLFDGLGNTISKYQPKLSAADWQPTKIWQALRRYWSAPTERNYNHSPEKLQLVFSDPGFGEGWRWWRMDPQDTLDGNFGKKTLVFELWHLQCREVVGANGDGSLWQLLSLPCVWSDAKRVIIMIPPQMLLQLLHYSSVVINVVILRMV